ncbi:carboxymuconolactone decarboxylase family protein [Desulfovibrio sulfodismutans]|uniref:Carboxymuconolactone decarboxylase family protein n=1 Tax=Desulfolutivibrio sulfodismutans TaxID=63561 RepID=A0A7K3NRJ9_9BACT|nr:carboxymuconolactone decarboxylase family protein [Desulfolutivibrio sulfodismutans]NDY58818.1 carboxymuconolactone decarboxylase family protein [Desulfolutivibrio sulfodismutans]QLA11339.1 carboxymuconolactone decarboxylase [Desulfolutivibrio sulfodismutans DSM 3696]
MNERYARGFAALAALAPEKAQAVQDALAEIAPDMGRFIVEFGYGEIFTRPGLDAVSRQTATIAALTALGNAAPQLRFHIEAGLAAGLSPQAVIDIIYVATVFAGFPAGLNAIAMAREVFAEKGVTPSHEARESGTGERRERGLAALAVTSKNAGQQVLDSLADIAPDFAGFILDFSYGDVISRDVLTPGQKEIAMIAAATARGTMEPQLKVHVKAARAVGLSREQIVEVIIQMAVYAGFPAAINGLFAARAALREMGE